MAKIRVGLVFGGRSAEHEVSVRSAANIYKALDKQKYDITLIGVDRFGGWQKIEPKWLPGFSEMKALDQVQHILTPQEVVTDVFFPIIHGTAGEDGSLQGLFEQMGVAYVGAGVLGSAIGMDKDVQKRLLRAAGVRVTDFLVLHQPVLTHEAKEFVESSGYPVFVKPANTGSSVGVTRCMQLDELEKAVKRAFAYDTKVVLEAGVAGRELEVGVLGNRPYEASVVGEVIVKGDFYDYEAKYIDVDAAEIQIPADDLDEDLVSKIQKLAIKSCEVLDVEGMARVDFFLRKDGEVFVNEINTLPGFTSVSMFPKLWEASGVKYSELLDRLIQLAIERHNRRMDLTRTLI